MNPGLPSASPHSYPVLFGAERARLVTLLELLEPAQWLLPTPCPGWDVLGLTTHLVGDDLSVISWHRDHYRVTVPPDGVDEAGFIRWLDELQIEWVHAARRISPRLAVELLRLLATPLTDTLSGQDATERCAHVSWASDDPVPRWLDHARELTEYWIHRQQILEALGRPSDLDEAIAGPVLDALRWAFPFRLGLAGVDRSEVIDIEIDHPFRRRWRLVGGSDGWRFDDDASDPASTVVRTDVERCWRLLTNNHRTADHGPIDAVDDPTTIDVLLRTRSIIGSPKPG